MKSLVRFLIQFHFIILFVILEIITLSVYFQNNEVHKQKIVNSSNVVVARFYESSGKLFEYFNLKKINYQLSLENAELKGKLKEAYKDNTVNILEIYDSVFTLKYNYIPAKVINNSINKQHNYLTIDKGLNQGIEKEMAVISPTGIVGIVNEVSENYATIISVLNSKLNISAKIKRNGYFGTLNWDGTDYNSISLKEIPNHVERIIGDTVITSGYSTIFPEGIMIGKISEIFEEEESNFVETKVELSTDFKNLTYVYVINNFDRLEQKELEGKSLND